MAAAAVTRVFIVGSPNHRRPIAGTKPETGGFGNEPRYGRSPYRRLCGAANRGLKMARAHFRDLHLDAESIG